MAAPTLDVEHEKDLRRRGAELDMAHKGYDRAKGHFHSRKARSTCTECHAFRPSRRQLPATDKSELEGAANRRRLYLHYDLDVIHTLRPFNGDVTGLIIAEPPEKYDDDGSVVPAPHTETTLAHVAVRPAKKRKGVASDFEIVPNPSHGVLALDDDVDSEDQDRVSDQDDFEHVDSDGDAVASAATPQRSYASAVRNVSA